MSKKSSISNGESPANQRLSRTFSTTPDLLLTGTTTNQRSQNSRKNNVVPNLKAVRNKNLDVKKNDEPNKRDGNNRGRNQRGKDARPNAKRNNPNLVQTVGFLSEGIGDAVHKKYESGGGFSRESSGAEPMARPRLVKNEQKHNKEDMEKEQRTLNRLLDDDGDSDDDIKDFSDEIRPIKINQLTSSKKLKSLKKDDDVKIKLEPVDFDAHNEEIPSLNGNAEIKQEPGTELKSELYHRMDSLFRPDANSVCLFQLPDSLPQKLPDVEEEPTKDDDHEDKPKSNPLNLSSLEHFNEGIIGKLVRYRSGRTKMIIGGFEYDIESAIPTEFKQHAVSVVSNTQQRSANMYSLGAVHTRYNVIPDWKWLFDKVDKP